MSFIKNVGIVALLTLSAVSTVHAAVFSIDPKATYLAVNEPTVSTPPPSPQAFLLSAFGFSAGQEVFIQRLGDFQEGATGTKKPTTGLPFTDTATSLFAVFSSNAVVSPVASNGNYYISAQYRLSGAISTGLPQAVSLPPYYNKSAMTDISQDFDVTNGAHVIVPAGASYIFFSTNDDLFGDNVDPDGDFAVSITAVPEASSLAMSLTGLCVLGLFGVVRNRQPRGKLQ